MTVSGYLQIGIRAPRCGFLTARKRERDGGSAGRRRAFSGSPAIEPTQAKGSPKVVSVPLVAAIGPDA
jgi:hypothetical protein